MCTESVGTERLIKKMCTVKLPQSVGTETCNWDVKQPTNWNRKVITTNVYSEVTRICWIREVLRKTVDNGQRCIRHHRNHPPPPPLSLPPHPPFVADLNSRFFQYFAT